MSIDDPSSLAVILVPGNSDSGYDGVREGYTLSRDDRNGRIKQGWSEQSAE